MLLDERIQISVLLSFHLDGLLYIFPRPYLCRRYDLIEGVQGLRGNGVVCVDMPLEFFWCLMERSPFEFVPVYVELVGVC